jgi:hypothetical protein
VRREFVNVICFTEQITGLFLVVNQMIKIRYQDHAFKGGTFLNYFFPISSKAAIVQIVFATFLIFQYKT